MKAVILAGGAGTRLQPLTTELPKPMVSLFGKPVLEHILLLLRKNGVEEAAITLHYLPEAVTGYFGDGSRWGMRLEYFYEEQPLGTAGGVKACRDFLGQEDFIVISGDCVCDFDLADCARLHRERRAEASLLLHRVAEPLEYGLVRTDEEGRVTAFVEKPGWGQVFTDQVNTGVYLLSPAVLDRVPDGRSFDFSKDLFPQLLRDKRPLYGQVPRGYWRDMGECGTYLQTVVDALDGKVILDLGLPQRGDGIWSAAPLDESAEVTAPCWIGPEVQLGPWSKLGPHTVLERGATVGRESVLRRTVVMGAAVGAESQLEGAILCPNARVGDGCSLYPGAVVGANATVGDHGVLRPQVRVWPGLQVKAGSRLTASLVSGPGPGGLVFDDDGIISGLIGGDLGPELVLDLGSALAEESGQVAVGWSGGPGAETLALAAAAGVTAAGGWVVDHDGVSPAAASWMGEFYGLTGGLFLQQQGDRLQLYCFGPQGQLLSRDRQRKLESTLLRRSLRRPPAQRMGGRRALANVSESYLAAAVQAAGPAGSHPVAAAVPEEGGELLASGLEWLGCQVSRSQQKGVPVFAARQGGRELAVWTEQGAPLSREEVLLLTCLALLEAGERVIALPPEAPAAAERLIHSLDGQVKRGPWVGRQRCLGDALFAACLIVRQLQHSGQPLTELVRQLPGCRVQRRVIPLHGGRSAVMGALSKRFPDARRMEHGMRVDLEGGSVWVAPAGNQEALRLAAEGPEAEIARELCDFMAREASQWDRL